MSDESDIEKPMLMPKKKIQKPLKIPSAKMLNQEPKKISTKLMIHQAIVDLTINNRKGVSLQAIKKYMVETYNVDTEKINYYIKKSIRLGVEVGTIVQVKGNGASGSFKLAPKKSKAEKKEKDTKKTKKLAENPEKPEQKKIKVSESSEKEKSTKAVEKNVAKKKDDKPKAKPSKKVEKKEKSTKKSEEKVVKKKSENVVKDSKSKESKTSKTSKMSKETSDVAKKRASMMKRKSIGSIIKAPKMKPKAR